MKKIFLTLVAVTLLLNSYSQGIFPVPDIYRFMNGWLSDTTFKVGRISSSDYRHVWDETYGIIEYRNTVVSKGMLLKGGDNGYENLSLGAARTYLRVNNAGTDAAWSKLKKADFDDIDASEVVFGAWDASGTAQTDDRMKFTSDFGLELFEAYINMSNSLNATEWNIGYDNNGAYGIYNSYPAAEEDYFLLKDFTTSIGVGSGIWIDKSTHYTLISQIQTSIPNYLFSIAGETNFGEDGKLKEYGGGAPEDYHVFVGDAADNEYRFEELLGAGGISLSYTAGVGLTIDGSGAGGGGSVTSVDLAITNTSGVGATTSVSGSPITGSGTITLNIPDAAIGVQRGLVTNGTQTFEGDKTFNNKINLNDDATFVDLVWFGSNKTKIDQNGRIYLYNNVTPAAGMLLKGDGTDFKTLSLGSANQVLSVNTGATDAEWGTVSSLLDINAVTSETIIDVDDDKLIMYDASEGANNSVTIEELFNEYAASYRKHSFDYYNEFINGVGTATGGGDVISVSSGTGAASTGTAATSASNVVGLLTSTTGTTATGRTAVVSYASAVALGGAETVFEYRIDGLSALSTVAERYALVVGFFDTYSAANQVDGVYFLYDEGGVSTGSAASANWQIVTVSNSNRTFTTTSSAVSTAGKILRIEINAAGTSVEFFIDGVSVGTHSANIPTGTSRAVGFGMLLIKSIGTTARSMNSDYIAVQLKYTTPKN